MQILQGVSQILDFEQSFEFCLKNFEFIFQSVTGICMPIGEGLFDRWGVHKLNRIGNIE